MIVETQSNSHGTDRPGEAALSVFLVDPEVLEMLQVLGAPGPSGFKRK